MVRITEAANQMVGALLATSSDERLAMLAALTSMAVDPRNCRHVQDALQVVATAVEEFEIQHSHDGRRVALVRTALKRVVSRSRKAS